MAVLTENYYDADRDLTYAMKRCHREAKDQQISILKLLIPVRLLTKPDKLPTQKLIQSYKQHDYLPMIESIRSGSVGNFNKYVDKKILEFFKRGMYFLLDRLKYLVYQRLFRYVAFIYAKMSDSDKEAVRMPLKVFQTVLYWYGEVLDIYQLECVVSKMICHGLVKGYLSHEHKKIVLMNGGSALQFPKQPSPICDGIF
jgi:hypothetical protein